MSLYDECKRDQVGPGAPSGGGGGVTTFLGLTDTPGTYSGNEFKFCQVAFDGSGLIFTNVWYQSVQANGVVAPFQRANINFIDGTNTTVTRADDAANNRTNVRIDAATGATDFLGLSDTPANYTGAALQNVRVNAGATGLEFYDPSYVTVADNNTSRPQQPVLNFIDGTNTTVTVTDDPGNNRSNVRIDSTGGGGTDSSAVQTFSYASSDANPFMTNNTLGRLYAVACVPLHNVVVQEIGFYCAQNNSGGTFGVGVYDASGIRLAYSSLQAINLGLNVITLDLAGPANLNGGTIYYLAVESNINSCGLVGLADTYNPPIGATVIPTQFFVPNSRSVDPTGFPPDISAFFGQVGGDSRKYWIAGGP